MSQSLRRLVDRASAGKYQQLTVFGGILKRKLGSNTMYDIVCIFIVGLNVLAWQMGWRHFPLPIFSCRYDVGGVNATDNIPRGILDTHRDAILKREL